MKKLFCIISVIFFAFISSSSYANPISIPMFNYLKKGKMKAGIRESYVLDEGINVTDTSWQSKTNSFVNYGLTKKIELGVFIPYTTKSQGNNNGLGDVEADAKWWFYSSGEEDFYYDYNLDMIFSLGGRFNTGGNGLGNGQTDVIISFLGKYNVGVYNRRDYNFFFNTRVYLPVEYKNTYKNILKYDAGFESRTGEKLSFFLAGRGEHATGYKKFFISPGVQLRPGKSWGVDFSVAVNIYDRGHLKNTESSFGIFKEF